MRRKGYKGRCVKRSLSKCRDICRTYDEIQAAYADILQSDDGVKEFQCNVFLDGMEEGDYTTDFLCVRSDGNMMVRECVFRKFLTKPLTVKLLDASRSYWLKRGITDWGIVIEAADKTNETCKLNTGDEMNGTNKMNNMEDYADGEE